ncbi:AhpC/TSA family protein [Pedobacter chinensis]|uniref:AhpC/TSA family protein n=1 Tax=Pedobacter chinensis TaxID=2282421 RepID=A0A369PSH5_9SPHI|nr:TlpA disulfide reductase family protein [Pedobacter chinensis]RDC55262.1 AhpC/TSA family protein [Pedobacter chinensis]
MLKKIKNWQLLLLIATAYIPVNSSAQIKEKKFTIKGDMTAMPADSIPKKIFLIYDSYLNKGIDSTIVTNGHYTFNGTLKIPISVSIRRNKDHHAIAGFIASAGVQEVVTLPSIKTRDAETARIRNVPMVSISDSSVVRGSVADSLYKINVMELAKVIYMSLPNRESLGFAGILAKYTQTQNEQIVREIKMRPNSLIAPMLVIKTANRIDRKTSDTLLKLLPKQTQDLVATELKKMFAASDAETQKDRVERQKIGPAIGTKAPEFTMNDTLGKPVSLSQFRGKYVLVDFWASWCAPCRVENPNLVRAYQKYKGKGLEIIGVSLDAANQKNAWIAAINSDEIYWTQLSDLLGWKNAVAQLYEVKTIPQNFLIDPDGKIVDKGLRGNELTTVLEGIFK